MWITKAFNSHVVNLLKQTTPPLSENCMGNIFWAAAAQYVAKSKPEFQKLMLTLLNS
jgi:hypothetical protein